MTAYENLKLKHPDWNWQEAENLELEGNIADLQAAADFFDREVEKIKKKQHD